MQMLGSNATGEKILEGKEEKSKVAEATDGGKAEKQNGSAEARSAMCSHHLDPAVQHGLD